MKKNYKQFCIRTKNDIEIDGYEEKEANECPVQAIISRAGGGKDKNTKMTDARKRRLVDPALALHDPMYEPPANVDAKGF